MQAAGLTTPSLLLQIAVTGQLEFLLLFDLFKYAIGIIRVDGVRAVSRKTQQRCLVSAMANPSQGQGAVETHADRLNAG